MMNRSMAHDEAKHRQEPVKVYLRAGDENSNDITIDRLEKIALLLNKAILNVHGSYELQ